VEEKLAADEAKAEFLDSTITATEKIVKQMESMLQAFNARIDNMEDNIRPVDEETSYLISQKSNLDKVRQLLEDVEEFYGLAARVKPTIEQGPGQLLDDYFKVLVRIDEALAYFEHNNPENYQLPALGNLRRTGQLKLEEQFRLLLNKNSPQPTQAHVSQQVEAIPELDRDDDRAADRALESCKLYPAWPLETTQTMTRILQWLHDADASSQTLRTYIQTRTAIIDVVLVLARKAQPTVRASRALSLSQQRAQKERTKSFLRKEGKRDSRAAARARRASELQQAQAADSSLAAVAYHVGDHPIISVLKASLLTLWHERQFARAVIHDQDSFFTVMRGLILPVLDKLQTESDQIVSQADSALEKGMFFSLTHIFDIIDQMEEMGPHLCNLLAEAGDDVPQKYFSIHLVLAEVARKIMFRFQDSINNDTLKKLPEDGTVHELTSRTLKYVQELLVWTEAAGTVLRTDLGSVRSGVSWLDTEGAAQLLGDWLHSVLNALQSNISRKAKSYENPAIAWIFLLNNYDYILRFLRSDRLEDVVDYIPQIFTTYENLVEEAVQRYSDATWRDILAVLEVEPINGQLSKKARETIKEKYTAFNEGLEKTLELQKDLSVPNKDLCEKLRRINIDVILPAYEKFDNAYRFSGFSQKNPQKYLKYMASDVEGVVKRFFSAVGN